MTTKPVCDILPDGSGVRLYVRLTPRASANAIKGMACDASGQQQLRVMVTAVPENGKANDALIKLLSKSGKWPKSAINIISGHTDRNKILVIGGDARAVQSQIIEWTGD
ncbi:DUF167 family protein [Thalassospira sp.]|uniref:DUF167 domain-containing protein n=1 Tax=Thalassospira sp. TaxID=1912094 RepID=UPI0027353153|nr:DUF167 family protein [Thalassospira sp.]MDP2699533.1 DUF167 family protein [Thalassospira sp.]